MTNLGHGMILHLMAQTSSVLISPREAGALVPSRQGSGTRRRAFPVLASSASAQWNCGSLSHPAPGFTV